MLLWRSGHCCTWTNTLLRYQGFPPPLGVLEVEWNGFMESLLFVHHLVLKSVEGGDSWIRSHWSKHVCDLHPSCSLSQAHLPVRRSGEQRWRRTAYSSHPVRAEEPSPPNSASRGGSAGALTPRGESFLGLGCTETPWPAVSVWAQCPNFSYTSSHLSQFLHLSSELLMPYLVYLFSSSRFRSSWLPLSAPSGSVPSLLWSRWASFSGLLW